MKVIYPTPTTDTTLISSTVEEQYGVDEWDVAETYGAGDRRWLEDSHRMYESTQSGNIGHDPQYDDGTWWIDVGPTNRWAMFDDSTGTYTESITEGEAIEVEIAPGTVTGLALLELEAQHVTVSMIAGAETVFEREFDLLITPVYDWFDYFFGRIEYRTEVIITDLPPYAEGVITITIENDGYAKCGVVALGRLITIGALQYNPTLGIVDYSRKYTDDYGHTTLIRRTYARKNNVSIVVENARLPSIYRTLSDLRATPCVWIGSEDPNFYPLIAYGFYRDFGIDIPYPGHSICNLEIEGLA